MLLAAKDILAYWSKAFQRWGKVYVPFPEPIRYWNPIPTNCGGYTERNNAHYCANKIYYHVPFFEEMVRKYGDFGPLAVLPHEAGHGVVAQLWGVNGRALHSVFGPHARAPFMASMETLTADIYVELACDCLSGTWAAGAGQYLILEPGDFEEGIAALSGLGDKYPAMDPWDHGTRKQRAWAFSLGFHGGPDRCLAVYLGR